jgi:hypothetical protein
LTDKFIALTDLVNEPASDKPDTRWTIVIDETNKDYMCQVHKRVGEDFFFRVLVDFESTPEETFDISSFN